MEGGGLFSDIISAQKYVDFDEEAQEGKELKKGNE